MGTITRTGGAWLCACVLLLWAVGCEAPPQAPQGAQRAESLQARAQAMTIANDDSATVTEGQPLNVAPPGLLANDTDADQRPLRAQGPEGSQETHSVAFSRKWGSAGDAEGQLSRVTGLVTDRSGNVYAVDGFNDRIQKFDRDGNFLLAWGSSGAGDGQLRTPLSVAIDPNGDVYVTEQDNNRVQKFDADGNFLLAWGSLGTGDGQFNTPSGVAVGPDGNVYVTDFENARVQVFGPQGNFLRKWGSRGSGNGQFNTPTHLAVDPQGDLWVADTGNDRLQKFSRTGTFLLSLGARGTANAQFRSPSNVAIDPYGFVYVADTSNHRIQKFTPSGAYLTQWGALGGGDGQFRQPFGLTANGAGEVYVGEALASRVQRFSQSIEYRFTTPKGAATLRSDGSYTYTPNVDALGQDAFTYRATNSLGLRSAPANVTLNIAPLNRAPTAQDLSVSLDEDLAADVLLVGSDPDNNVLTYTVTQQPTKGSLSGTVPYLYYLPSPNQNGPDSFTYVVSDGQRESAPATVTITINPINDAPTVENQAFDFEEDAGATLFVLQGTDVDGDALSYEVLTQPFHGVLSGSAPNLAFTPNPNAYGAATFTFKVNDGSLDSRVATVTLNVISINDPPMPQDDAATTREDTPLEVAAPGVLGNDSDVDTFVRSAQPAGGSLAWEVHASFGSYGPGLGNFSFSRGLVHDPEGNLYVSDFEFHRVQKFDPQNRLVGVFGGMGTGDGQFNRPCGLAFHDGKLYVADRDNARVQVLSADGQFLSKFGVMGTEDGQLTWPFSLAVSPQGVVHVGDTALHRVYRFDPEGAYLGTLASFGGEPGQLNGPFGMAFDREGKLYVAEVFNHRVQVFGAQGESVGVIGGGQSGELGGLSLPTGVVFDAQGRLLVMEEGNDRIQRFAPNLQPQGVLIEGLGDPSGISVSPSGSVHVGESFYSRVTELRAPAQQVLQGQVGALTLRQDGSYSYQPYPDASGVDVFRYEALDELGAASAPASLTITVTSVNDAPVANDGAITLDEDAAPYEYALTATDVEGDPLRYRVTAQPQKGSLACDFEACIYTPNPDANGDDAFSFVANDGQLDSAPATVTLTINPSADAPLALDQALSLYQDTSLALTLTGSDVDGDALSFGVVAQPQHGLLECEGATCTYTPEAAFVGEDSFDFIADDGTSSSEPATVTITVAPSDGDDDGTLNNDDNCPLVRNVDQADLDQDGVGDVCDDDDDQDGSPDLDDNCPVLENADQLNSDDDPDGDACDPDDDNDGLTDDADNCPMLPNDDQADANDDGAGDACSEDDDGDGIADADDLCPLTPDPAQDNLDGDAQGDACDPDDDQDGVEDADDNCALLANPDQLDADTDGAGDACDPDDDADGLQDADDNCPLDANPDQTDADDDGLGAACDDDDQPIKPDADADGISDDADNCPDDENPDQADADQDGLGDPCDDADNNAGNNPNNAGNNPNNADNNATNNADNNATNNGDDDGGGGVAGASDDGCGCAQPAKPVGHRGALVGLLVGLVGLCVVRRRR
jgi:VCBS repeat-containing protein